MPIVWFVDTSVLCELLEVPGKAQQSGEIRTVAQERMDAGHLFVLPITAVIETGNHIANAVSDGRRDAAVALEKLIDSVRGGRQPWALNEVSWDADFLADLSPDR